ncbi:hypothetical protein J6590_006375 [Homalodisca vitripennis]|nr:hypothetical protein J6590_006375 [Homalodisca vitripennis]
MIIDEYGGTKLDRHCLFSLTTSYLISIRHAQTVLVIEMRRVPPAISAGQHRRSTLAAKAVLDRKYRMFPVNPPQSRTKPSSGYSQGSAGSSNLHCDVWRSHRPGLTVARVCVQWVWAS